MKRALFGMVAFVTLFAVSGMAEEKPNETNLPGTGFFTKVTKGRNFEQKSLQSGGLCSDTGTTLIAGFLLRPITDSPGTRRNTWFRAQVQRSSLISHQATIDAALNLPFAGSAPGLVPIPAPLVAGSTYSVPLGL